MSNDPFSTSNINPNEPTFEPEGAIPEIEEEQNVQDTLDFDSFFDYTEPQQVVQDTLDFDSFFDYTAQDTTDTLDFDSFFDYQKEEKQLTPLQKTQLNYVSLDEIEQDDKFIEGEYANMQKDPNAFKRFVYGFMKGVLPVPEGTFGIDFTSDIKPADNLTDQVAGVAGEVLGFGSGLFATGGILGGLKIIGTGAKVSKPLATAYKGYVNAEKLKKAAKVAKKTSVKKGLLTRAKNAEQKADEVIEKAGVIKSNSLLGKSSNYKKFITKLGAGEYQYGKFISRIKGQKAGLKLSSDTGIKVANAIDSGITNIVASNIFMQKTIPLGDNDTFFTIDRLTKPTLDGVFMTVAGMPRILGKAGLSTLKGSTAKGLTLEASTAFSAGFGASILGAGVEQENPGVLDHAMTGGIFVAAQFAGVGADKLRINQAIKEGVEFSIADKKIAKEVIKKSKEAVPVIQDYLATKRPEFARRRFVNKKDGDELVQLLGVKQTKNKKNHALTYKVLTDTKSNTAGKNFTVMGTTRQDAVNKFFKTYKNVLPEKGKRSVAYFKEFPYKYESGVKLKKSNPEAYKKEHQPLAKQIEKAEQDLGMSKKESSTLKRIGFTKSFGNTERMNIEEMTTYKSMLRSKRNYSTLEKAQEQSPIPLLKSIVLKPTNQSTITQIKQSINRFIFSPESNLNELGSDGIKISKKLTDHSDIKEVTRGKFNLHLDEVAEDFKINKKNAKQINSLTYTLNDSKINLLIPEENISLLGDKIKQSDIAKRNRDFFDDVFLYSVRNGVKANTSAKGSKKDFKNLLTVFDKKGKAVKVSDESFDNGDMLKVLRKKQTSVINTEGKKVSVDINKTLSESLYQENYAPRFLSNKGKDYVLNNKDALIRIVMRQNGIGKKDSIDGKEIQRMVENYIEFSSDNKPLGILNTRKFDIPPYIATEKGTNAIIHLDEIPNISKVKVGESILDIDGKERVIGDVVELYEKDFSEIIKRYSNQVSNSIGLFRNFDEEGLSGVEIKSLVSNIRNKYGDSSADWVKELLKYQLGGEKITTSVRVAQGTSKTIATAYLSGPSAAIKNLMTGQTQTATSFGLRNLFKSYYRMLTGDYKKYSKLTTDVGGLTGSADELALKFQGKFGDIASAPTKVFMEVEKFNRRAAVATADAAMRDAFNLLTNKKSSLFRNKRYAKDVILNGMRVNVDDFDYMLSALKEVDKSTRRLKDFDYLVGTNGKFRDIYKKALYKSQAATQGATRLPYIPVWMSKGNLKPLTLFYRTAYRVTENAYQRAFVPFVADGNPFPMLKYLGLSTFTGKVLYDYYYGMALGQDLIGKDFKGKEREIMDYAVKGEALGLFSNMYDSYGNNVIGAYIPVPIQFGAEMGNFIKNEVEAFGDIQAMQKIGFDYTKKQLSFVNQAIKFYENQNQVINKDFKDVRRLQYQYLESFPQLRSSNRGALSKLIEAGRVSESKFWVKLLKESLLKNGVEGQGGDLDQLKNDMIKTRAFLMEEKIKKYDEQEKSYTLGDVVKEVNSDIMTQLKIALRPYPEAWEKKVGGKTRYQDFLSRLSEENKNKVEDIENIYYSLVGSKPTKRGASVVAESSLMYKLLNDEDLIFFSR